jgi:mannose-6-phosphate isomerase
MDSLYPLTFQPVLKQRVWGGRRLDLLYKKPLPRDVPVGESWEISDRPEDVSIIANGSLAGKDLHWLMETRGRELLGRAPLQSKRFPLLIKILDATEKLSLQVHPPAHKAAQLGGEPKTEFWYIAEASPDAELYVGLRKGCTRQEFADKMQAGTVADCFHRLRVRAGDAMFLPSGRVHALGAGMVIFEIQQNSDTTYRVFDWNRLGLDGKPRDLHIDQSMASIDFGDFEPELVRPQPRPGASQIRTLVKHPLFEVELMSLNADQQLPLTPATMQIIGVVSGEVRVISIQGEAALSAGQFCLVPASVTHTALRTGTATTCLCVRLGEQTS